MMPWWAWVLAYVVLSLVLGIVLGKYLKWRRRGH